MRSYFQSISKVVLTMFVGGAVLSGCSLTSSAPKADIVSTITPTASLVADIVGPGITVSSIIPPGVSPHDFEPTPQDVAKIQNAKIVFRIGRGFDDWMNPFIEGKKIVTLTDGIADLVDKQDPSVINPHVWVSPHRILPMIQLIALALKTDTSMNLSAIDIETRSALVTQTFQKIDDDYRNTISQFENKDIIAVHEAWDYLANDYDLSIAWTIEPVPGQEPSAQTILALRKVIQERSIKTIFSEPQLSQETINAIARDLGVKVLVLNPEGSSAITSLEALMRFNLEQLQKGLES